MTCRSCGITIADKAIVCFKCGTPTADLAPVPRTAARRQGIPWPLIAVVVAVAGVGAWLIPKTEPTSWTRWAAWGALAMAVVVSIRVFLRPRSGRLSR